MPVAQGCASAGRAPGLSFGAGRRQGWGAAAWQDGDREVLSGLGSSSYPVQDGFDPGVRQSQGAAGERSGHGFFTLLDARALQGLGVHSRQGCSSEAAARNGSFGFIAAMGNSVRLFPCRRHHQLLARSPGVKDQSWKVHPRPTYCVMFMGTLEILCCCLPAGCLNRTPPWPLLQLGIIKPANSDMPVSLSCPVPGFHGQAALERALRTSSEDSCLPSREVTSLCLSFKKKK